ncbi:hypothetical protein ACFC09_33025 [Streptomyces sp. NPDC056161]|uniref:hypothetical protein n=1 Tax=Streptomyces sp. NPDC056161 TaxID=3345732 RepID=UPI0035D9A1BE
MPRSWWCIYVSDVPTLTIPYTGVWEIAYNAHVNFALPASGGVLLIHTDLRSDNGVMEGSEAITGIQSASGFGFQATAGRGNTGDPAPCGGLYPAATTWPAVT